MSNVIVMLHNIRSTHNVGSIFRTSDAAGVSRVILTGYTPTPTDRFGRPQKDIEKTALGAQCSVPWEYYKTPFPMLRALKAEGYTIVGIEQDMRSEDYRAYRASDKTILVFGNEVRGLSRPLRDQCDVLLEIPMRGALLRDVRHPHHTRHGKESLNVSVAAGIVLFSLR